MNKLNPYVVQDFPKILNNKEIKYYVELFKGSNINARDKLIEHNLLLVVYSSKI